MKSLFDDTIAYQYHDDPLALRVYTSRLLGQEPGLVLHGGGNTSVKQSGVLYVKGSGWNLDTIEKPGFSPVDLATLIAMAEYESLSDAQMVKEQRDALKDPSAPNPSIEAILHAIIPFDFVDHTHADAVVTLTNTPNGREIIKTLYGSKMLIVEYVMPGFELAKHIYDLTRTIDWNRLEGMILLNHGVFTFDNDAKRAYEKMIDIVTRAEAYLASHTALPEATAYEETLPEEVEELVARVSELRGCPVTPVALATPQAKAFSLLENLETIVKRGGLTPEHVIRIKPFPAIIDTSVLEGIDTFVRDYRAYFAAHASPGHICLDPAPRYAIIKGYGAVALGKDAKESSIIADIVAHTMRAVLLAEQLGGWTSLSPAQLFAMEYWELEQMKLKNA